MPPSTAPDTPRNTAYNNQSALSPVLGNLFCFVGFTGFAGLFGTGLSAALFTLNVYEIKLGLSFGAAASLPALDCLAAKK